VQLILRFVSAPGADLKAVLSSRDDASSSALAPYTGSSLSGSVSAYDPEGPKEERIFDVPARKKGHLLGLHGQTIELIRSTSGVIKCHIMADRDRGYAAKDGSIPVQIFGAPDKVETCISLIERVMAGDHSGIGHSSDYVAVDPAKVERLKGDRWQVINAMKDLTGAYMDVLQGADAGMLPGETQLFIAGPAECVDRARTIVQALLSIMDQLPANGEASPELLGSLISSVSLTNGTGASTNQRF